MLPPRIRTKILTPHNALGKVPQSLRAGAILSLWIRVFG
jgi:hypothetical protein